MVDKVYDDTLAGYRFSKRLGDEIVEEHLARVCSQIDTTGVCRGQERERLRKADRSFTCLPPLRRTLGPALARRSAIW